MFRDRTSCSVGSLSRLTILAGPGGGCEVRSTMAAVSAVDLGAALSPTSRLLACVLMKVSSPAKSAFNVQLLVLAHAQRMVSADGRKACNWQTSDSLISMIDFIICIHVAVAATSSL